jgi:hypothetical protein
MIFLYKNVLYFFLHRATDCRRLATRVEIKETGGTKGLYTL